MVSVLGVATVLGVCVWIFTFSLSQIHAEIGGSPFAVCGVSLVTGSTFEPGDRLHRV
jgi:hypothetical protein